MRRERISIVVVHSTSESLAYLYVVGAICALVIIKSIVSALRGTAVELRVTNLEFISSGDAPEDYSPSVIARADIYNLQYREASGGGDFPELPEGFTSSITAQDLGCVTKVPAFCHTSTRSRQNRLSKQSIAAFPILANCHRLEHLNPI